MTNWILSSNPTTTYRAEDSIRANDGTMDWISKNRFAIGDIVYIYESKNGGRGGIVFKMTVIETGLSLDSKINDREYWVGGDYPEYITSLSRFNRLKLVGYPRGGMIRYEILKGKGFAAPPTGAYKLDEKRELLNYIERHFS